SMASAHKAGRAGVPMYQAHLGGPAEAFKSRIDLYRQTAEERGYDVSKLPVATAGFFFAHEDKLEAYRKYYPHINEGMKKSNGKGFPKQSFAERQCYRIVIKVGDHDLIIEKILYQNVLFNHDRYIAQLDFGCVTLDDIKRNIDIIGEKILPTIKKYTTPQGEQ